MSKFIMGLLGVFAIIAISSCDDEPDPVDMCDTTNMTYNSDIKEIFDSTCTFSGCHDMDAALTIGSLTSYDNAVAFVEFGRILGAINHEATFKPMPYPVGTTKMPQCNIDKITAWINDGTPE